MNDFDPFHPMAPQQLLEQAFDLVGQKDFEEARARFGQAADLFQNNGDSTSWCRCLCLMSEMSLHLGRFEEAVETSSWATGALVDCPDGNIRSEIERAFAITLRESGDMDRSIRHLQSALEQAQACGNPTQVVNSLIQLRLAFRRSGRHAEADELLEQVKAESETHDPWARFAALMTLAEAAVEAQHLPAAFEFSRAAKAVAAEAPNEDSLPARQSILGSFGLVDAMQHTAHALIGYPFN